MNLYLDASALVKRYVAEPESDTVREAMSEARAWYMCRVGFVETVRAVTLSGGTRAADAFRREWPAFGVVEVDESLAEHAAELTILHGLRSLDAIHLAAGLVLPREDLVFAAWDQRLHSAADAEGLSLLPGGSD